MRVPIYILPLFLQLVTSYNRWSYKLAPRLLNDNQRPLVRRELISCAQNRAGRVTPPPAALRCHALRSPRLGDSARRKFFLATLR